MTAANSRHWALLVYRIPAQPTRLRLQIWRRLQKMGALYLQNAVCLLPARPDLVENMQYVAASIEEMGGECHLFKVESLLPGGDARLAEEFRELAARRLDEIGERLDGLQDRIESSATLSDLERVEEELKRERIAFLRARRLTYFDSGRESEIDGKLDRLKRALDDLYRSEK